MPHYPREIEYSDKYFDDYYEYRNVGMPRELFKMMPAKRLLSESEWRSLGVIQSRGWVHFAIHKPEPYILLFRRPLGTDPDTGNVPIEVAKKIQDFENKKKQEFDVGNNRGHKERIKNNSIVVNTAYSNGNVRNCADSNIITESSIV